MKELDNEDRLAAAKLVVASAPSIHRAPDPISIGALLWHDLIEIRDVEFAHITDKGRSWLKSKGVET